MMQSNGRPPRFKVRYYDARRSKKGQGTQDRYFDDEQEAIEFASKNRYRARPCRVEPLFAEQS